MAASASLVLSSAGLAGQGSGTDSRDPDRQGAGRCVHLAPGIPGWWGTCLSSDQSSRLPSWPRKDLSFGCSWSPGSPHSGQQVRVGREEEDLPLASDRLTRLS